MTENPAAAPGGPDPSPGLPKELLERHRRVLSTRERARRSIAKARQRRRIVPPLAVGSAVLVGSGLAATFVDGTLPGVATRAAPTSAAATTASAASSAVAATLAKVRQALKTDEQALVGLGKAATTAAARAKADARTTVVVGTGGASGGSTSPSAPGAGAAGGQASLPALPALPALPPMPSMNIPVVHGSTGASAVAP